MTKREKLRRKNWLVLLTTSVAAGAGIIGLPALADPGDTRTTPATPIEVPVEIEVETGIGSLKQAPLWREHYRVLEEPQSVVPCAESPTGYCADIERRPGFGTDMPPLHAWSSCYNFLTGQPLRLRTSDGEVSWDVPGPLFDPDEEVATSAEPGSPNVPTELRTVIGALVASNDDVLDPGDVDCEAGVDGNTCGYLLVSNTDAHPAIPPDGTVVAVPACDEDGVLHEAEVDPDTGELELSVVTELEIPVNEEDFFRPEEDTKGVPWALRSYIGRHAAEVLGKALFWDMQIGSDGVQACGSCHFHAGADNRTRGQLNSNTLGGDFTLQVKPPNTDVEAGDFPFHQLVNPDIGGESTSCGFPTLGACADPAVASDANDAMSSMGVSRFKRFIDIPAIGNDSFLAEVDGVRALAPDLGAIEPDPVPVNEGFRRVEPRNTPTFHGAAFNFDNFWDARARFNFNGGSVFGPSDPTPHIFINTGTCGWSGTLEAATMGHLRPDLLEEDPDVATQPVRVKFSSLASQAVGPPLSNFEMSFDGRNWPKIGKKLLQGERGNLAKLGNGAPQECGTNRKKAVVPLANQRVAVDDSRLGPFSNQGGSVCEELDRPTAPGKPGLCISYGDLIRLAFARHFWNAKHRHLEGAPDPSDPFDGYSLTIANGRANPRDTDEFTQMEANFSAFFGLSVQAYESLTIPDDTLFDQFLDANPRAGNGVGQPGEQGVLFPTLVPGLVDVGSCPPDTVRNGVLCLIPDDPTTPEYDGFGPEELFGFDIFAGANLTAALEVGSPRNPAGWGSNPFTRTGRCMQCHLGPEQTDHSINIAHGIIKGDAELEFPSPPIVPDPGAPDNCVFEDCMLPAPEPPGVVAAVPGLILSEEVAEGAAQDAVEVEPRDFATFDDPASPWDDRIVAQPRRFAFGDQGIYNIGLRPNAEDLGRGGLDPFGWPLSLATLTLKNLAGPGFEPGTVMADIDPFDLLAHFEETGDGAFFSGTTHTLQSINPGLERDPIFPQMPDYMAPWLHGFPAGELHPLIDELGGFAPNTLTPPNGGPGIEFTEVLFGDDLHCGVYDPVAFGAGPPAFGWGPSCPTNTSGVAGNFAFPVQGSWPDVNQVLRDGAFKAPALRNVEMTGPYFHTGSYLTLRQVIDFYIRGGDFPLTNAADRDPHILDLRMQAFAFGSTIPAEMGEIPAVGMVLGGVLYIGTFANALPDTVYQYTFMPDVDHTVTPEPATTTQEQAVDALVTFLLSLTDPRVKYQRAPFDRPEIFVPIDGAAPENVGGRAQLVGLSGVPCTAASTGECFRRLPEVGAAGEADPLPNFLGISSTPVVGPDNDHFDR